MVIIFLPRRDAKMGGLSVIRYILCLSVLLAGCVRSAPPQSNAQPTSAAQDITRPSLASGDAEGISGDELFVGTYCHATSADIFVSADAESGALSARIDLYAPQGTTAQVRPFAVTRAGEGVVRYDSTYAFTLTIDLRAAAKLDSKSPGTIDAVVDGKPLKANVMCTIR